MYYIIDNIVSIIDYHLLTNIVIYTILINYIGILITN